MNIYLEEMIDYKWHKVHGNSPMLGSTALWETGLQTLLLLGTTTAKVTPTLLELGFPVRPKPPISIFSNEGFYIDSSYVISPIYLEEIRNKAMIAFMSNQNNALKISSQYRQLIDGLPKSKTNNPRLLVVAKK